MRPFPYRSFHQAQEGQVLLIVVLIMVVALTVGLGVVSRSIIQVKTAKDQGDSQKAFSAAEAGVEQALKNNTQITNQQLGNNAAISNVTVNSSTSPKLVLNNGSQLFQDDGTDVWLAKYPDYSSPWTGRMRVFWGSNTGCTEAALEVIVISQPSPPGYSMQHYTLDPCSSRATNGNNFTVVNPSSGGTVDGTTFTYSAPVDITSGLIARIIPLYANTMVGIIGYKSASPENDTNLNPFNPQGTVITSIGTSGSTQREIIYFQGYNQLPSELFSSLFVPQ